MYEACSCIHTDEMEGGRPLCGRSNDNFFVCAISAERNTLHKNLAPFLRVTIRTYAPSLRRPGSVIFELRMKL